MWWLLIGLLGSEYSYLILAAVIPAVILLVQVYKADKLEKESGWLLISLLLLGALACLPAGLLEGIGDGLLQATAGADSFIYNVLMYFGVVAFAEEGFKYLFMRLRTRRNPEFNCRFDGIVFAVFVSLGFAIAENISYVLSYGFAVAVVRALTSVPGHAAFGVFMGVFYGLEKQWADYGWPGRAANCRALALVVPALLHGAYDFLACYSDGACALLFLVFIIVMFVFAFVAVRRSSRTDRYI